MRRSGSKIAEGKKVRVRRVAKCFLFLLLATSVALAQAPTATILGTVKDSSGAMMPNTSVTAQNRETGLKRVISTGADGSYRFAALPVGTYEIRVEQLGFQTEVRGPITLTVAQEAVLNFSLEVGGVEQTISVTADAPLVETTSGSLGGLVSEEKVADLPLNGRNYINLTLLQPGVTQQANIGGSASTIGTWFSTNGAPLRSNNYTLDGTSINDPSGGTTGSVGGNTIGIEAIREWRMITNSFSAEYGMTMGSQMVMVSKSGTNSFNGSLFEYFRNAALDARDFFDRQTELTPRRLPGFSRNSFGGSVGGPIRRDKAFFFVAYEKLTERLGLTQITNTIPASARIDEGLVPQIAPVVKPLLALFPLPNLPPSQYTFPATQPTEDTVGSARVDLMFSDKDTMFVRGTVDDGQRTDPLSYVQFSRYRFSRVQLYALSESHIFTPTLVNTARLAFSRFNRGTRSSSGIIGPEYSFVPGMEIGSISIGSVTGFGPDSLSPFGIKENLYTWSDDLFYTKGRHSLKFGTLINHAHQFYYKDLNGKGAIAFSTLNTFLLAQPTSFRRLAPNGITDRTWQFNTFGFYAHDDLRMNSRLTLNVGLRYEFLTTPMEMKNHHAAFRDIANDASTTVAPEAFQNPSLQNFSPRFGFAWDVMGNGKTAVRGGFGMLYDVATFGSSLSTSTTGTPPFSNLNVVSSPGTFTMPLTFPPASVQVTSSARLLDYYVQQPRLLQYNLTVQRQLPASMALTLSYVGTRGMHLMAITEGNPTVPEIQPDGRQFFRVGAPRTNPYFATIEFHQAEGDSWYNGLQVGLAQRLSHGLQFQTNYTWSRCIDVTQAQLPGETSADNAFAQDPLNRSANRGRCIFDATQNFRFNSLYRLPQPAAEGILGALLGGWWTGAILSAQTGLPITPVLNSNRSRAGVNGGAAGIDHPDLVPGRTSKSIVSGQSAGCLGAEAGRPLGGPDLYFDPCAFAIPAAGYFGNAGRTILSGPGLFTLDLTLSKDTPVKYLGESGKLQFRADLFNILNRANFSAPNRNVFAGTANVQAPLSTAGQITSTNASARQIQLALKLLF